MNEERMCPDPSLADAFRSPPVLNTPSDLCHSVFSFHFVVSRTPEATDSFLPKALPVPHLDLGASTDLVCSTFTFLISTS